MRNPLKIPIILVLLVGGAYLLAKGAMYLRVQGFMEDLQEQASGSAEISYQGISTDLRGAASVEGLRIRPQGIDQAVEIERVRFASDDAWSLIVGGDWRKGEKPPEHMSLSIDGVRIELTEQMLEAMQQQADNRPNLADPQRSACEGGTQFDPRMLRQMGFDALRMDVQLNYRFDRLEERLRAEMAFEIRDIERGEMSIELGGVLPEDIQAGQASAPALARAQLAVEVEREFGNRFLKQCATEQQLTVDAYRTALLERLHNDFASAGVTLGEGLKQAIDDFYRDWGEVRVTLRPEKPLGMLQLMGINRDNAIYLLGLSLAVNGRPVPDLTFDFDIQALMRSANFASPGSELPPTKPIPPMVRITRSYRAVPVAALDQYIGSEVKIQPKSQPLRQGALVALNAGEVQIEQRTHGGSLTSYVRLEEIESVEVMVVNKKVLKDP